MNFKGNKDDKVLGRSLVDLLWVEVGTELGPCDEMSDGRNVEELEGLGEIYSRENVYMGWSLRSPLM